MSEPDNYLLYDGDCPFCSNYVAYTRLREAAGPIAMRDAREHPDLVRMHAQAGRDINQGMILHLDGATYFGGDVLNRLALMSTRSDAFNALTAALFRSPRLARLLYPALRAGRNLTLRLLGKKPIELSPEAKAGSDRSGPA
ncbi:DCC1-like thiol-disulfide oxidoreductase family protein [Bosea sp. NPDC055332]